MKKILIIGGADYVGLSLLILISQRFEKIV